MMEFHPGHFHGISHEQDVQWLISLPITKHIFIGDGVKTRWRIKYEARKVASFGGQFFQHDVNSWRRNVEIDEDSHYLNITPPLMEGQRYEVEYHYVGSL